MLFFKLSSAHEKYDIKFFRETWYATNTMARECASVNVKRFGCFDDFETKHSARERFPKPRTFFLLHFSKHSQDVNFKFVNFQKQLENFSFTDFKNIQGDICM